MALALAAFLCLASGFVIVNVGWSRRSPLASDLLLRAPLSVGYGLGLFSVIFFIGRVFGLTHWIAVDLVVFAVLLAVYLLARSRLSPSARSSLPKENLDGPPWFRGTLIAAFTVALVSALYAAVLRALAHPHGDGWDAFAIWNLHARFLFLGRTHWRDGFSALIPWSHPDYPLLLPAAVAHFWSYVGHDDPAVPAVIGFLFDFSVVALLFSALSRLRGGIPAMLGGIALLSTPSFLELGAWQYADIPLSFFFLATLVLLRLHDEYPRDDTTQQSPGFQILAGLAAGFAAWTKNEGVLFLCALVVARRLILLLHRGPREATKDTLAGVRQVTPFLLAVLPIFLLIAYFKRFVAPPGDLFADPATILHKLLDPSRYRTIIDWLWSTKDFLLFGQWMFLPTPVLMLCYYCVAGRGRRSRGDLSFRISALTLALTLAGYFAIYVITPYDLSWHLRFSLVRLFLQLWPSAIFLFFLKVPYSTNAPRGGS